MATDATMRSADRGKRANWVVDDYFRPGARHVTFLGRPVVKYHRTLEEHLAAVRDAGFRFSRLSECQPVRDRFLADEAEYGRRLRIPLFLLVEAENPTPNRYHQATGPPTRGTSCVER